MFTNLYVLFLIVIITPLEKMESKTQKIIIFYLYTKDEQRMNFNASLNEYNINCRPHPDGLSSIRTKEINDRIYDRNIPSQVLQPYLDVRPVMTKYSIMPIVDPRAPSNVPMIQQPIYNTNSVFNPGNNGAPWSGFASNINIESELKGQVFALQSCSKSVYVPSSNSDLYHFGFKPDPSKNQEMQPFQELFAHEHFTKFNPNPENIGNDNFNNCTRQQLKNIPEPTSDCR
jgi:hypothetical protein